MTTILVVDDLPLNIEVLASILGPHYRVVSAGSGAEALEICHSNPPDLLLLDVMMPGMDGYEVCRCLKADLRTCDIPVIFITAMDAPEDEELAFTLGAVDFIAKPFRPSIVLARIRTQLDLRRARDKLRDYSNELEAEVRHRTARLAAAMKELEGFTYAASHDMKAPLGRINSFCALLDQRYRSRLEGDGLIFLDHIQQNAQRLQILVDDLLSHALLGQDALPLAPVEVTSIIRAALHERALEFQEGNVELRIDLPARLDVLGNPMGLAQVLRNLIDNALKYSALVQSPIVEVGGQVDGDTCHLWVRDNGIGIDPVYHDKIFEMFRRLHAYAEYPGTGVGLAIVRKAMECMGGKVWVSSQPGQGATFHLELPAAQS